MRYCWVLFCLLLARLSVQQQPVTASAGFVKQTQYLSCSEYMGFVDCGNTQNNVTVISLSIQPGLGNETRYEFQTVSNVESVDDVISGVLSCPPGGLCTVVQQYRVRVVTKPTTIMYQIQDTGITFPHVYSAHYTPVNSNTASTGSLDQTFSRCNGTGILQEYLVDRNGGAPPTPPDANGKNGGYSYSNTISPTLGAFFSWTCTVEESPTVMATQYYPPAATGILPFKTPITPGCIGVPTYQNLLYPYAYRCIDGPSGVDTLLPGVTFSSFPSAYSAPLSIIPPYTQVKMTPHTASYVMCTKRVPVIGYQNYWAKNSQCPYFMFLWNGIYEYPLRYASPFIDYSVCGNPAPCIAGGPTECLSDADYNSLKSTIYPPPYNGANQPTLATDNLPGGFGNNLGFYGFDYANPKIQGYLQDFFAVPHQTDANVADQNRCLQSYGFLTDASPVEQYYGGNQRLGYLPLRRIQSPVAVAAICNGVDPETKGTWYLNPVPLGVGNFFSDLSPQSGVFPVSYEDSIANAYKCGQKTCGPGGIRDKDSNTTPVCGATDYYCGTGRIGSVIGKDGVRRVPMARCQPTDYCGDDRLGIIETRNHDIRRYNTAETPGGVGPDCKGWDIQSTALPYFEATAILELLNPRTGEYEFVGNSTVSNVNIYEFSQPTATESQAAGATYNFQGAQGNSQTSASNLINLQFDYFSTPNGQIAPDFPSDLSLIICNTSSSFGLIFMGDPNDPTVNPWYKIDAKVQKASGGYTPLAKNLQYVTNDGRTINSPGASFMFYPTSKIGRGGNQLGMLLEWAGDKYNAQSVCQLPRYASVPGWIAGFDWTIQERITDQLNASCPGCKERALREQVSTPTPGMIMAYFRDYEAQTTCEGFRLYNPTNPLRFMFPSMVAASDSNKCPLPRCWLNGLYIFCEATATTNNNIRAELRLAVLGTVLRTETVISSGKFQIDVTHPVTCAVDASTNTGLLSLYVKNTGIDVGAYQVQGNCTGGITLTPTIVGNLAAGQISPIVNINVAQSGLIPQGTLCDVYLVNPQYTNVILDYFNTTGCAVITSTDAELVRAERVQTLCEFTASCPVPNAYSDFQDGVLWVSVGTFLFVILLLGVATAIGCIAQQRTEKLKIDAGSAAAPIGRN